MLRTPSQLVGFEKYCAFLSPLALVGMVSVFTAPATAAPHLPVPTESFLSYHAANVRELSQEASVDPQVRARLAKHYHITQAQMTTYIHNNLVLRRLQHAGTYRVACVRRDGSEYYLAEHLPAGTPIFASRATGQPILKLACGNPMASTLPVTVFPNKPLAAPKLASTPVTMADADLNTPPVLTDIDGTQADLITPGDNTALPVVLVSPSIQALGGSSGLSSIFPLLLGAGAAVAVAGHGGSSSSSVLPLVPIPQAVPEASTVTSFGLLLLGSGLLLIVRRKVRPENA
jgi:hypothetical protein